MSQLEYRPLHEESIQVLQEIFVIIKSTGEGVDSVVYRAQHEDQLNFLDELEKNEYLRKENEKYLITLCGLALLNDPYVKELFTRFEKIFLTLRSHYKATPRDNLKVTNLASSLELTFRETMECLSYMVEGRWWKSHSLNIQKPEDAHVQPSESILKYHTFQEIISELMNWRNNREKEHIKGKRTDFFPSVSGPVPREVPSDIIAATLDPGGPIFSLLFDQKSDAVQRIVELAGLVPDWSLSKEQSFSHKTRNRAYRERVVTLYSELSPDLQQRFILNVSKELINLNEHHRERLREVLRRVGWDFIEDRLIQIDVLTAADLLNLPETASEDLLKAAERLSDDCSGAISAACGAVDSVCEKIYERHNLGDIGRASFQERVNRSLVAVSALENLYSELLRLGWDGREAFIFRQNLKGAISHAAYVMQTLRSKMGDVHGTKPYIDMLAFDSIKWAMIISSLLRESER